MAWYYVLLVLLAVYYGSSFLVSAILLRVSRSAYEKVPWQYLRINLIPFVGFLLFCLVWLGEVADHFLNVESDAREGSRRLREKKEDGSSE